jgi:formiminotetrahydrofolate cyclodeaminase
MNETDYDVTGVEEFLAAVATRRPAPSAGAVAALSVASAAGLASVAARCSDTELRRLAEPVDELRHRLVVLADEDAAGYAAVLSGVRLLADATRRAQVLTEATRVPLAVAAAAEQVAQLGARLAAEGDPKLAGNARAAVRLAEVGVRAAAELVHIHVRHGRLDPALAAAADERVRSTSALAR